MFPVISRKKFEDIQYPCMVDVKLDGECVLWNGKHLVNKYDKVYDKVNTEGLPKKYNLLGEMYVGKGKEYYSELHNHRTEWGKYKLKFFDIADEGEIYWRRNLMLQHILSPELIVEQSICKNEKEVKKLFKKYVDMGYEGIVAKPIHSHYSSSWVKLKREYTDKLYVVGRRRDRKPNGDLKRAVTLGNGKHIFCSASLVGWEKLEELLQDGEIIGKDKENYLLKPEVVVEVRHNGYIGRERENCKLRHPRIKRICDYKTNLTL